MSSSYQVPRCHHIKTNGTQCNSPALRNERLCYFHNKWRTQFLWLNHHKMPHPVGEIILPVLEDASSIQSAIGQVMSLVLQDVIDSKKAGLLLYALQTATSNLGRLLSETHQDMYCDPEITARTPLRGWTFAPWELEIMEKAAAEEAAKEEKSRENARQIAEAAVATEPAEQSSTTEDAQAAESKKKPESEAEPGLIAEIHAVAERRSAGVPVCPTKRTSTGAPHNAVFVVWDPAKEKDRHKRAGAPFLRLEN